MPASSPKRRSIKRLHLDLRNPRLGHPLATTEQEAMERLIKNFGDKITALARSIADKGLSPGESWLVVKEGSRYVVLEGNRRLVACRLLDDSSKAPDSETARIFMRIKRRIEDESYLKPLCVEFNSRSEARYWIQLKHHGQGNGEGTAAWGPEMVYLDRINNEEIDPIEWNEFWYWLEDIYKHDNSLASLIDRARSEQYTLMERVYSWKVKELLGAGFISTGQLGVKVDPEKIKPFIYAIIKGMLTSSSKRENDNGSIVISSRTLNTRGEAERKIGDIWKDIIGDADVSSSDLTLGNSNNLEKNSKNHQIESSTGSVVEVSAGSGKLPDSQQSHRNNFSQVRTSRPTKAETHIYAGVSGNNMPLRVKKILRECRKSKIEDSPQTASVMARVVLELALDAFIDHRGIGFDHNGHPNLKLKIIRVMSEIDPKIKTRSPDKGDLKGAWSAVNMKSDKSIINHLHSCVHDYKFTAPSDMANNSNELFTPLLNAINDELGKPVANESSQVDLKDQV